MNKYLTLCLAIGVSVVMLAGCASGPLSGGGAEVSEQSIGSPYSRTPGGDEGGVTTSAASQGADWYGDELEDPNSMLATRVIYFDFDQSDIGADNRDVVSAHAQYLANNSQVTVRLEGHADERGTREYNLGLGEKRANSVRSLLMAEGVSDSQIIVVSYGEERAAAEEHNEEAWALNRRVEFVY